MSGSTFAWRTDATSSVSGYAIAVLSVAAAAVTFATLQRMLGIDPSISLFLCAVMFVAWISGTGPALLATAFAVLTFGYMLTRADPSLVLLKHLPRLLLFAITALVAVSLSALYRRANLQLQRLQDEHRLTAQNLQVLNERLSLENAERREALERGRLAEKELRDIIDTIPALAARHGPDGVIDFVNQAWRSYTGLSQADWENMARGSLAASSITHPDDWPPVERKWLEHMKEGVPFETEQRLRRYDGKYRWHFMRRVPLRDDDGKLIAWYGAGYDIEERKRAEEALRKSEQELLEAKHELQTAIDSVATMIVVLDHNGAAYYANRPSREYLGESLSIKDVREAIHPDDREMVNRLWREHLISGEPFQTEQRMRRADGQYRWNFMTRVPLRDDSGRVIRWYGSGYDIHDRKIAQDALLKSQAQLAATERELRLTLDLIPALAWRTRADGSAEYLNKRWLDYTGFAPEQGLGWNWQNAIHPDDRQLVLEAWQRMLQSGKPEDIEARMRRFDGVYRWFLFRAETLCDDSGNIVAWYGTNTDIEDRKQVENALQRSEANLVEAQRISQTGTIAWDPDNERRFWSDETYKIMGFERDVEPTTDMILERVHPDDREHFRYELNRAREDAESFDFESRLLMPDGQTKHLHIRARRLKYGSGREEVIGAIMDVSAAKRSQEALDAARSALAHASRVATLGEINATIAHEVNQPLAAIIANAETCLRRLAGDAPDYERVRRAVEWIAKDGRRAGAVIQRVRGLSRKADAQKVPLDLNEVIGEVTVLLRRELAVQRVTLRLELEPSLPQIMGDRVQLQQVIINLVMNAVEAMQTAPDGENSLVVRSCRAAQGVIVTVKDNGIGISDETKSRLFDAFFSTKPNGLGIGLSICRSIVEDHEGKLSAANNAGEPGATFKLELPSVLDQTILSLHGATTELRSLS